MANTTQPNLRRAEREPATLPISLVLRSEDRPTRYEATTIDLSLGGASVQTYLELVPGEWVGIVPKGEFPFAIPSRVVWVRGDRSNQWTFAGLEFLDVSEA